MALCEDFTERTFLLSNSNLNRVKRYKYDKTQIIKNLSRTFKVPTHPQHPCYVSPLRLKKVSIFSLRPTVSLIMTFATVNLSFDFSAF